MTRVEPSPRADSRDGAHATPRHGFELSTLADDPGLRAVTDFAARLCDCQIALVSFVEDERQWFPARTGLHVGETSRDVSFCAHAMLNREVMIVPDATLDPRFSDNPLVTGDPHIRFYAGAPLITDEGAALGALCVIDRQPRDGLTDLQLEGLQVLAANIMTLLTQRHATFLSDRGLSEESLKFRVLADAMPQMVWSTRPDGFHDYYNARWYEFTGVPAGSTDGEGWNDMFHPDDQERSWARWRHSLETGDPYEIEYRLRDARGEYRWTLGRALPIRDDAGRIIRWFGTCTDIHDQKMIEVQREVVSQELSHRIKNIFSVVIGLINFSTRQHPTMKEVAADLSHRIMALGRAHDFVRPHSEASKPSAAQNSLRGLLEALLAAYSGRFELSGDDIEIDDRSATPLALLFHELATNAAKYGALSSPSGRVNVRFMRDEAKVTIHWREEGGPTVEPPASEGFGSKLIELSATRQMGGTVERDWANDGLHVVITIPSSAMHRPGENNSAAR